MELEEARRLFPLATEAGLRGLARVAEHPAAPRWTHRLGDHVRREDLDALERFRLELAGAEAAPAPGGAPPPALLERLRGLLPRVPLWRERVPRGLDLARDWGAVPTTDREDLATAIELSVPEDAPLERLIVYETSGTTGHALRVPHHPGAVALLHALAERALAWHGVGVAEGAGRVACVALRAQASVWVYPSLFSAWREAAFARVNLSERAWAGGAAAARRFVAELEPGFLSGDPVSFAEARAWGIEGRPRALLSTALALAPAVRAALAERWRCPVLDWYSTTETGPVACSRPDGDGLALLAPDLHVEVVDREGRPLPEGERGEVTVSGGRNPYLPLLRYRTGDFARLERRPGGAQGEETRLVALEGRAATLFRAADGAPVNAVDVGRALRNGFGVAQHRFLQRADGSCVATLRPAGGLPVDPRRVEAELRELFGPGVPIEVELDPGLGADGKVLPWAAEAPAGGAG